MPNVFIMVLYALVVSFFANPAAGFWRLPCRGRAGVARIDPLVSFGEPSGHAHIVFGGQGKLKI